jgi:hypothetical protein
MGSPYAFPNSATRHPDDPGMTLRDWFAGQAFPVAFERAVGISYDGDHYARAARLAYKMADAMLEDREL